MAGDIKEQTLEDDDQKNVAIRFCPICGTKMEQGMRYGFLCWICPECDFDEPV